MVRMSKRKSNFINEESFFFVNWFREISRLFIVDCGAMFLISYAEWFFFFKWRSRRKLSALLSVNKEIQAKREKFNLFWKVR